MDINVEKLIENVSRIRFQGGIFAKASTVVIVVSACIFGIAALAGNIWVSGGAIGLIFVMTMVTLWRLINFANRNPQAAILEGAEFLVHEQMQLAAKGVASIPQSLTNLIEETPVTFDKESQRLANQPDDSEKTRKDENNG